MNGQIFTVICWLCKMPSSCPYQAKCIKTLTLTRAVLNDYANEGLDRPRAPRTRDSGLLLTPVPQIGLVTLAQLNLLLLLCN